MKNYITHMIDIAPFPSLNIAHIYFYKIFV